MILGVIFFVLLACLHYVLVTRSRGFFTGDGIFVAAQVLAVFGTLSLQVPADPVYYKYFWVMTVPACVYIAASIILHVAHPVRAKRITVIWAPFRDGEVALVLASVVIVILYFSAVGYNTFIVGIQSTLSGTEADIASLRLESYAGSRYLAPGYVNQFKNIILPAMAVIGAILLRRQKNPIFWTWVVLVGGVALVGLLGTGQRGAFVLAGLAGVTMLRHVSYGDRFVRRLVPVALTVVAILMLSTLVLGRSSDEVAQSASATEKSQVLLSELWKRVSQDNQGAGLTAFRYTETMPTARGSDWAGEILGLTPFHRGTTLSGEVFATKYGSNRGTMPPSTWGSAYYNFGPVGLLVLPVILAYTNHWVARRFYAKENRDILQVAGYSGVFVVLGMWVAGGPSALFNTGLGAYILLIMIGNWRARRGDASIPSISPQTKPISN